MAKDYALLITSEHSDQPRFGALVSLLANSISQVTDVVGSFPAIYDLDVAVGVQLDVVGRWVGVSRDQEVPVSAAFFTWNDPAKGWNYASW